MLSVHYCLQLTISTPFLDQVRALRLVPLHRPTGELAAERSSGIGHGGALDMMVTLWSAAKGVQRLL